MKIHLMSIAQKMPAWVTAGYIEYAKRLPPEHSLHLIEVPLAKRSKNSVAEKYIAEEGERMLAKIPLKAHIVALDERGEKWTTLYLAKQLHAWRQQGNDIYLLIGGPDGLAPACLSRAKQCWSLSCLTLPHPFVRILLAEQIYRAHSILAGHPYHRGE